MRRGIFAQRILEREFTGFCGEIDLLRLPSHYTEKAYGYSQDVPLRLPFPFSMELGFFYPLKMGLPLWSRVRDPELWAWSLGEQWTLQTRREVQVIFTGYLVCVKNFMSLLEIIMVGEISE